jgi:sialic acid synthase SpsE
VENHLIVDIGSNHFGDLETAKKLIKVAKQCGATLVKGQAYRAKDIKSGSMPLDFYEMCQMELWQYLELIGYAKDLGIDMFYSIFSKELNDIKLHQKYNKISAPQFKANQYEESDLQKNTFVSVPIGHWHKPTNNATVLYVSDYLTADPLLESIPVMKRYYNKENIGYSDHTVGIDNCALAHYKYNVNIIEKHFCLKKYIKYKDITFRDTIHAANPGELERLANILLK